MKKFIMLTFAFLGLAFYELSGGADFEPAVASAQASAETSAPESSGDRDILARANAEAAPTENAAQAEVIEASAETKAPAEKPLEASLSTKSAEPERSAAETEQAALPMVEVAGSRVNLREGPGTTNPVIVTLEGGTEAEKIESRDGWARIRISETGQEGWMAERLLSEI